LLFGRSVADLAGPHCALAKRDGLRSALAEGEVGEARPGRECDESVAPALVPPALIFLVLAVLT